MHHGLLPVTLPRLHHSDADTVRNVVLEVYSTLCCETFLLLVFLSLFYSVTVQLLMYRNVLFDLRAVMLNYFYIRTIYWLFWS